MTTTSCSSSAAMRAHGRGERDGGYRPEDRAGRFKARATARETDSQTECMGDVPLRFFEPNTAATALSRRGCVPLLPPCWSSSIGSAVNSAGLDLYPICRARGNRRGLAVRTVVGTDWSKRVEGCSADEERHCRVTRSSLLLFLELRLEGLLAFGDRRFVARWWIYTDSLRLRGTFVSLSSMLKYAPCAPGRCRTEASSVSAKVLR